MSKNSKRGLSALGILVVFVLAVLVSGAFYGIGALLNPPGLKGSRYEMRDFLQQKHGDSAKDRWLDEMCSRGLVRDTFTVMGHRKMHAIYIRAQEPTPRTAFLIHGWTNNAPSMMQIGYMYYALLGYNIFLPDLNGHGMSGGQGAQMGWKDRLDCLEWMDMANEMFSVTDSAGHRRDCEMVVHGISMGAATTMCLSGEQTKPYVKAFVEDCGYTDVWEEVLWYKRDLPLKEPLIWASSILCSIKNGWDFHEASPLDQVAKCQKPMLFIHGDQDDFVPTRMVYPLYEAKQGIKALYIAKDSRHAASFLDHPEEYTETVKNFLAPYIP